MKGFLSRGLIVALAMFAAGGASSVGWADAAADSQDVSTVANANNAFGAQLFGHLAHNDGGNIFFSPFSISNALAMTYNGARGETAAQMGRVLHFSLDTTRMNAAYAALANGLQGTIENGGAQVYDLALANALWVASGMPINNDFVQAVQQNFGAQVQQADFANNAPQVADDINGWVSDKTQGLIKNLISPSMLVARTRVVLVNAIYFKGNWANAFEEGATVNQPFFLNGGSKVTVPMMNQEETISYMENDQLQIAEFPYVGNKVSMVVLLPSAKRGLNAALNGVTGGKLNQWLAKMSPAQADVSLPRFQLETTFQLGSVLSTMGMPTAFTRQADFSGIAQNLQLSFVIHKAFVQVNETGTKAAAATGVGFTATIATSAPPPVVFRVDRPFLFLIRDVNSGAILFLGRVTNPNNN